MRHERCQACRDRAHGQGRCRPLVVRRVEAQRDCPGARFDCGRRIRAAGRAHRQRLVLLVPEGAGAKAVSVGAEPTGAPAEVIELGGGPDGFVGILADQLERRRRGDVPDVDRDPEWTLTFEGLDPHLERVRESILTLADGRLGTRGAPLFDHPATAPGVLFSGVYVGNGPATELAPCPDWTRIAPARRNRPKITRRLDLATGLLREEGSLTSLRFSSLARPGTVVLRAQANPAAVACAVTAAGRTNRWRWLFETADAALFSNALVPTTRRARSAGCPRRRREDRVRRAAARASGGWARRWAAADVVVEGDPELQRAIRLPSST